MKKVEIKPYEKGMTLRITTSSHEYYFAFEGKNKEELIKSMDEIDCPSHYRYLIDENRESVIKEFNK